MENVIKIQYFLCFYSNKHGNKTVTEQALTHIHLHTHTAVTKTAGAHEQEQDEKK